MKKILFIDIQNEGDLVLARKMGRELSKSLHFTSVNQAKVITAISELGRNMYYYAGSGSFVFEILGKNPKVGIKITATDNGPGIENINKALEPGYTTSGGLGVGLSGVNKLMDEFFIESAVGTGTSITVTKWQ
ncbi:anti-sigma regulatory factor [Peribacillus deserti]|uniref:ATP-binding protein n=1 Tax=Peribacillus deserti TaxID=673318 RepID=A0A2N5M0K3_9BACI|nr:anti-sigma regulatory factor [Peribacillus deserti]PLT27904.1 ATP-binding protein [Peribacillus deserti]